MKHSIALIVLALPLLRQPAQAQIYNLDGPMVMAFGGGGGSQQSFLGVAVAEVDASRAKDLKLPDVHGVEITRMDDNTAAMKAGLKVGDVVLEYNGQRVEGTEQFIRLVRETPPGHDVKLLISRNGASQTVPVTMGSRKTNVLLGKSTDTWFDMPDMQMPDLPHVVTAWSSSMLGIEGEGLSKQLAEYFGVKEGVLVRSVTKASAAEKAGIKAGDVIVKIDQTAVSTPGEVTHAVRAARMKGSFPIDLIRDKHQSTVTVNLEDDHTEHILPRSHPVRM